ncbi:acyltransferase family protein [Gammaproteobacteria bacterium]|nr:acyltransferase family protein [Gammaproteobacteria bacterium]
MKYRAEIDGLRALAVIPVIFFHAGFEIFAGGFVGVDVFFVISGYLITLIIINDIEKERFSIINFYERRARRILPALFLIMLTTIPFAWMWMVPTQLNDYSQSLIAVSLFASNILFWRESGYFDAAAEEKPLLHTWSLAVEEQYYLLFPIFLFLVWSFGKNRVFWIIVAIAALSLLISEIGWRKYPSANFYLAPARAWELLAGSISAFIVQKKGIQKSNLLAFIGLFSIIFSIFFYDNSTPFPSLYALVPVAGVFLIVLYGDKETLVGRLLSNKILVGVGLISYSAYLWHQPIFAFARIRLLNHPSDLLMIILCLVSIFLAYLSWRYIEKPFRNKNVVNRKNIFIFSLSGILFFSFIGSLGHFGIVESKFKAASFDNWRDDSSCIVLKTTDFNKVKDELKQRCHDSKSNKNYILIGDSHAESLSKNLRLMIEKRGGNLITLIHNGCLPVPGTTRYPVQQKCIENKEAYWRFIQSKNATVILSSRWRLLLEGPRFNNLEGGVEYGDNAVNSVISSDKNIFDYVENFFEESSKKNSIIIVNQIPEAGWNVPYRNARIKQLHGDQEDITTSYKVYKDANLRVNDMFNRLIENTEIKVVSTEKLICNTIYKERCLNTINGKSLYRDDDHPSPLYVKLIVEEIENIIDLD